VFGAEALVRWRHRTRGDLSPVSFLGLAEEMGHIASLDLHVLQVALADLAAWRAAGAELRVAVNFSAQTLTSPGLAGVIERSLATAGVPGSLLEIELTESMAVPDPLVLRGIIDSLRELGVSVAVDDVGTGYSSLALLLQLPAQRIKIDRSFVQRLPHDAACRSVVEAVLLLADRLGQTAIAEGVETLEQMSALMALGCTFAQGYLFARPRPAEEVRAMAAGGLRRQAGRSSTR
jgi:EAL domain-containing protein (putative c-di-GMP-specific phosphodiesterase class I)